MIIVHLKGGLGNQLFQISAAFSLGKRLGQKVCFDDGFFRHQQLRGLKIDKLLISNDIIKAKDNSIILRLYKTRIGNKLLRLFKLNTVPYGRHKLYLVDSSKRTMKVFFEVKAQDVYLDGYFQEDTYFVNCRNTLLALLKPKYKQDDSYAFYEKKIISTNSVAIHIRRGDFTSVKSKYHYLLGPEYYQHAINYLKSKISSPVFYCFSDDLEWVKNNIFFSDEVVFVALQTENADIDELFLMANCKHIITANSTFSWWAAWLNDNKTSIKIVPKKSYGNPNMIPSSWIRLD